MGSSSGGSSRDEAARRNVVTGDGSRVLINNPHLKPRQGSNSPSARRSSGKNLSPYRGEPPTTGPQNEAPGFPHKKRKVAVEEAQAPLGVSKVIKTSASHSPMSRDPNRTSSSMDGGAERRAMSEDGTIGNASSAPKGRKCMPIKDYLDLFKKARKREDPGVPVKSATPSSVPTKTNKVKEIPFKKLERLPDGCHLDFDNDHLFSINKLREFWHKSQGSILIDDKELVMKTILFILSILPDVYQPILLVTTASVPIWEAEFNRFAPCIIVVVYDRKKDVRKLIQNLEFRENGNHRMLHVLLAHPDAILEDMKNVECIRWEAVIVDCCQTSFLQHLRQLRHVPTDSRMVLLSSPLKDNLLEFKNLLAFLHSEEEDTGGCVDADAPILRARFTRHVAYERKSVDSKFLEHWVPAYLSVAQLELYCSILRAKSSVLQSQLATDSVGALHDIVFCLWKFCNHPCLVDECQQNSLLNSCNGTESIDDMGRASGKLLLLGKMLTEIRKKNLRVIIFFHSDGAGGDRIGTILKEFVHNRFGPESYEHVQKSSVFSMKKAAMDMFNDTTKGRFVFLIESRACLPSIILSSVDAVIIYGSLQNPLNDLKALQKINIESQPKYVRIFRLYTPFTVEEKVLVLAKQSMIDSSSEDIVSNFGHCLLSWGVSFLFRRLDELQQDNDAIKSYERDTVFMDKVISEFLTLLSADVEESDNVNITTIVKACMSGEFYSRNITLIGEREGVSSLDGDPPKFWLDLLDARSPSHCYTTEETIGARKKPRKIGEIAGSSLKSSSDVINNNLISEISTPSNAALHLLPETGVENHSTPKGLRMELKRELSKLSLVLKLPDNVSFLAKQFLEYTLNNHLLPREPLAILHAFNIALCWRAAALLKANLDHKKSLALAVDCLNYECNEERIGFFFKKLRFLKEKVAYRQGEKSNKTPHDRFSSHESSSANLMNDHMFAKQSMDLHGNSKNGTPQGSSSAGEQMVSDAQELVSAPEAGRKYHLSVEGPPNMTTKKRIDLFNHVFSLREKNILEKQQHEILELRTQRENQVIKLKEVQCLVVEHIRMSNIDEETRDDQIKLMMQWFNTLLYAFLEHMRLQHSTLVALQSTAWSKEEKLKQKVMLGQLDQSLDLSIPLPDSNFVIEEFTHFKKQIDGHHVVNILASGCDRPLVAGLIMEINLVRIDASEAFSTQAGRNEPAEAHVRSIGESVDLPESSTHCSSDGIDLQRACCSSVTPTGDSINQESSTGEGRSIEHAKRDNISSPSMLPGSTTSLLIANNDGTVATDHAHLESPILAFQGSLVALQHPPAEAEPNDTLHAMVAQHPPAEAEPNDTLLAMVARDLQTSCSTLDSQSRRMCSDDSSKMSIEPDTATGRLQEGTTSYHLDDASMQVKCADAVAADPQNPAVSPDACEAETEIDESIMPAQRSTGPHAQQKLATPGHPLIEAETPSNLDTEAAGNLQPDIQPSSSTLHAESCQAGCQPEITPDQLQEGDTYHHLADNARMGGNANNNATVISHQIHSGSPTFATSQSPAMLPFSLEVETGANLPSMSTQRSTVHPPAVAELTDMLITQAESDSRPDVQTSSILLPDVPLQRVLPDDSSQTCCRPATDLSEEGGTDYACTTPSLASLSLSRAAGTENGQTSVPVPQSASAQHSLATWQHPPEVAESTGTLGVVPADDLTPSTSMLAAESEQADMLGASAAEDLQHEVQPSTMAHDVPLERTGLSNMPMTENTTVPPSVEPSWDPFAEPAGNLGVVSAPDLWPRMQSPSSMQDQHLEAGACTSETIPDQTSQSETQRLTSVQHIPRETIHPDERIQIVQQPYTTSGAQHITHLFTVPPAAFHNLLCSSDPLRNELIKLVHYKALLSKDHEKKKSLLQTEYNQEMERVKNKYELSLQELDFRFHQKQTEVNDVYRKVSVQQAIAENFREKFLKSPESSANPTTGQAPQHSQRAPSMTPAAETTRLPAASASAMPNSFHSTGSFLQPSQVVQPAASEAIQLHQSMLPGGYLYRSVSPLSSVPLRNGSYRATGAQSRGPVPLLQQLRMPPPSVTVSWGHQQLPVTSLGIASPRLSSPGLLERYASPSPVAGAPLTSAASGLVQQQATPSAESNSGVGASAQLSGLHPELIASLVQSNPVAMVSQQAASPNPGFHYMPGAAGNWQPGGHIAGGTDQAVPEVVWEASQRRWRASMSGAVLTSRTSGLVGQAMASAGSRNQVLMAAAQQAVTPSPSLHNMAAPLNAAGGVWRPVPGSAAWLNAMSAGSTGPSSGAAGAGAQGGGNAEAEVVCLSDGDE